MLSALRRLTHKARVKLGFVERRDVFVRDGDSWIVYDSRVVDEYLKSPDSMALVSFPRTGSHWLCMMLEVYFERPCLVRTFFFPRGDSFLLYHTHDMYLDFVHPRVIYLWRSPVDTIYSQLRYEGEPINEESVVRWTQRYAEHLLKWVLTESFTKEKLIVMYDRILQNPLEEIGKVIRFLGGAPILEKIEEICATFDKSVTAKKVVHDPKVIDISKQYKEEKERFKKEYASIVEVTMENYFPAYRKIVG